MWWVVVDFKWRCLLVYHMALDWLFPFLFASNLRNLCVGVILGCRQREPKNIGWVNCWLIFVLRKLFMMWRIYMLRLCIHKWIFCLLVLARIFGWSVRYYCSILGNSDGILTSCCLGLQNEGNVWLVCSCFKEYYYVLILNGHSYVGLLDDHQSVIILICCLLYYIYLFCKIITTSSGRWYICWQD